MSNLDSIAEKYIDDAKKLYSSATKYILGFILIIFFCWYFAERVFSKTKYETIRFNRIEEKVDAYKNFKGNLDKQKQREYKYLKEERNYQEDTTTIETYKAIEENVPSGFKFLLKKITQRPYGIFLSAITVLAFMIYLYNLRVRYLAKLGIALRIIKSETGYNKVYDYNFRLPFWALPVPAHNKNGVEQKDIKIIGGLNRVTSFNNPLIFMLLGILVFIQYRLYYISLITNSYLLNWILIAQTIAFAATAFTLILWFLPYDINDTYNHEPYVNPNSRRNFITAISIFSIGAGLGFFSGGLSKLLVKRTLKPRHVIHKKKKVISDVFVIELKAMAAIRANKTEEAAAILFAEINRPASNGKQLNRIRLFDLLIILCFQYKAIYATYFHKTMNLARFSSVEELKQRFSTWSHLTEKNKRKIINRSYWDKIKIK